MVLNLVGLEISVPEFIWTIITFLLLMFLLKKILYDPILKHMDQRDARVEAGLEEGRRAKQALEDSKAQFAQELSQTGAEARAVINDARSAADAERSKLLAGAHKQVEALHAEARARISAEESDARKTTENSTPEYVQLLTEKLLGRKADS